MEIKFRLEKFNENDFPHYFSLVNNEKVMQMITGRAIKMQEAQIDFQKLLDNNLIDKHFGSFRIIDSETNDFIGLAKMKLIEIDNTETEIGYMILPKYWGKGIASQVAKELIESTIKQQKIKRIFAIIDPMNLASRKILINHGFNSIEFRDFDGLPGEILNLTIPFCPIENK